MYVVVCSSSKAPRYFFIYIFKYFFREFTCLLCSSSSSSKVIFFKGSRWERRWLFWFQPGCCCICFENESFVANIANMGGIFEVSRSFSSSFYDDDISRSLSSCQTPLDNSGLFSALLKFELIGYLGRDFFEAYKEKKEMVNRGYTPRYFLQRLRN